MAPAAQSLDAEDRKAAEALAYGFYALAALTYCLIVLGALVRAHGAGLSCPDWPLCFGAVIPEFNFQIAFEWGHRAIAGSVAVIFSILAWATLRRPDLNHLMRKGLLIAAILLAAQIVLGGLTVLQLLAFWTVTSHLVTGNAFALVLVLLARRLATRYDSPRSDDAAIAVTPAQRLMTTLAGGTLATQIVLGGLVASTYAGLACPDWPTCMNDEFFPTWTGIQGLHLFHRMVGYSTGIAIAIAAWTSRSHPATRRLLMTAAGLALAQIAVGVANVLLRLPVEITGLHSALAAALVCTMGVAVFEVWRSPNTGSNSA